MESDDILKRLTEHRVEFVLIGGFAAVAHGATIVTADVDVCLRFEKGNLLRLLGALTGLHPRHRLTPKKPPFQIIGDSWRELESLHLDLDNGVLDCLPEVKGIGPYDRVLLASEFVRLPFGECRILKLDQLIRAKEAMGRPSDRLVLKQLVLIQKKRDGA